MSVTIHLPPREQTISFHRNRWAELVANPLWADVPGRMETNQFGHVIMHPPPSGPHCHRQAKIARYLDRLMGEEAFTVCPLVTADGVKELDAAWYSPERYARVRGQSAFEIAPEICIEVISPSNMSDEMIAKRKLYFDAGAIECWTCDQSGEMAYFVGGDAISSHQHSNLCTTFPSHIPD
ncbi:MAG: Uma2 family endonuclease [Planctomycetota bacterium]